MAEAHAERAGRAESARQQQRQEGPQPASGREAGAETDVEEDAVHAESRGWCDTVPLQADPGSAWTIDDRCGGQEHARARSGGRGGEERQGQWSDRAAEAATGAELARRHTSWRATRRCSRRARAA